MVGFLLFTNEMLSAIVPKKIPSPWLNFMQFSIFLVCGRELNKCHIWVFYQLGSVMIWQLSVFLSLVYLVFYFFSIACHWL